MTETSKRERGRISKAEEPRLRNTVIYLTSKLLKNIGLTANAAAKLIAKELGISSGHVHNIISKDEQAKKDYESIKSKAEG